MKKNWSDTLIVNEKKFFNLYLDKKLLKSIEKNKFDFTNEKLAKILKEEIDQQGLEINFKKLFYFNLFSIAIDKIKNNKVTYINEICEYAFTDLICYRAEKPDELVQLQNDLWNPVLRKLYKVDLKFKIVSGIMPVEQPINSINILKNRLRKLNELEISCLFELTKVTGSILLAYSMICNFFDKKYIYDCSFLDDIWQSKKWGMINEISENLTKKKLIIKKIEKVLNIMK